MKLSKPLFFLTTALLAASARADNWPQFRGPNFNGSTEEKNLPTQWSKTDNVAWSMSMPGTSASTVAIWGDFVFTSSTDDQAKALEAFCLDRKTGNVVWKDQASIGFSQDAKSNFASPSPTTDGKVVVFFYGNGDLVTYDFQGKKLWTHNIQKEYGPFAFNWTFSTSPLLYDGKLYLQVLQRDVPVNGRGRADGPNESYLLAFDPATGKQLWRVVRPSEAVAESRESFTTPTPFEVGGKKELLVVGGDCLTGHDAATGKELWRWGTWNPMKIQHWRQVVSAVAGDGIVLACAPKKEPIYAIKLGGSGVLNDSAIAWTSEKNGPISTDVPTPAFYQNDFFVLGDAKRNLSRVEPKTGKAKWTIDLPGRSKYEVSPTAADGKIYVMNFAGDVVIVGAEKGEIIATIPMGDPGDDMIRSGIAASHGQLFIRTGHKLYCIGGKQTVAQAK